MIEDFDAIVVGAGPAGSAAALVMARAGLRVALIERGDYPGAKNVSGAALHASALLHELIPEYWNVAPVERFVTRRVLSLLDRDSAVSVDARISAFGEAPYNAFTILRPTFDRWFAAQAERAGALLICGTLVDDVLRDGNRVIGVRCHRAQGDLCAPVVIAADGANAFLAKRMGLQREFRADEMTLGVKEVLALDRHIIEERFNLRDDEGMTIEYVGAVTGLVKGGGFLYTNRDSLSIGIVTQIASLAHERQKPYELLDAFKRHPAVAPLVRDSVAIEYSAHIIPEGGWGMVPQLSTDGFLVVGDAAAFVFATGMYLEGINFAIASGRMAGETVLGAKARGDFSAASLAEYRRRLEQSFVLRDLRRFRHAPHFVNNERLQNVYPAVACQFAEAIFRTTGQPHPKLGAALWRTLRAKGITLRHLARDAWDAGRAMLW
jgi:electron transfer flavoprotein-quinone oxidoreductase